jgi:hypothetical protein
MDISFGSSTSIVEGVFIGGAGGAIAGITLWVVNLIQKSYLNQQHKNRVYKWLQANTKNEAGFSFRSTLAIASWNNLTEDRVRYICSIHKRIFLSTGHEEDMWSIYDRKFRSVYENKGVETTDL